MIFQYHIADMSITPYINPNDVEIFKSVLRYNRLTIFEDSINSLRGITKELVIIKY